MHPFLRYATDRKGQIVEDIGKLVTLETPSESPEDLAKGLDLLASLAGEQWSAQWVRGEGKTPSLLLEFGIPNGRDRQGILGLGHIDTVWPKGTLSTMPFREEGGRLWGPGVLDMKAGLVFFLWAGRLLRELDSAPARLIRLLVVADEETGSQGSRSTTESVASRCKCVLVLEPGTGLAGKLKTARKGVGRYTIKVVGRAAHSGVDFSAGASAISELAVQIDHLSKMTNLETGITVNVGVIQGGTKPNVVAAEAVAEVDLRVVTTAQGQEMDRRLRSLKSRDERCTISVSGGLNRPPMERSEAIANLYRKASEIASGLGIDIDESATGGGSDGSFTAALGIPTLDGLGAVGEGAHARNESILVDRIPDRVALLAALLQQL